MYSPPQGVLKKEWSGRPSFKTNLTSHLFYYIPAMRRRSLIPPNLRKLRFVGIRDDRLFCGTQEEETAIRTDILFMKYFTHESPFLPPANQLHTCHPERQRGISFSLSAMDLN
jgi:hypothetical protein